MQEAMAHTVKISIVQVFITYSMWFFLSKMQIKNIENASKSFSQMS